LLYAAMREFLNHPDAYVLGRDCRAFPPVSLAQFRTEPPTTSLSTGARQFPPASVNRWPGVTSPGNHGNTGQVRGPWYTPDALCTPPDRTADSGTGQRLYQRRAGAQNQRAMGAGYGTAQRAGVGMAARQQTRPDRDAAELNTSMNRATTSDDRPSTSKFVTFSSTSLDGEHHPTSPAAAASSSQSSDVVSSAPPLTVAGQSPHHDRLTTSQDPPMFVTSSLGDRRLAARTLTTGPLTSTPFDRDAQLTHAVFPGSEGTSL